MLAVAIKKELKPGVVAHAHKPRTQEAEAEDCQEFGASVGYIVNSSSAWATIQESMRGMYDQFCLR